MRVMRSYYRDKRGQKKIVQKVVFPMKKKFALFFLLLQRDADLAEQTITLLKDFQQKFS